MHKESVSIDQLYHKTENVLLFGSFKSLAILLAVSFILHLTHVLWRNFQLANRGIQTSKWKEHIHFGSISNLAVRRSGRINAHTHPWQLWVGELLYNRHVPAMSSRRYAPSINPAQEILTPGPETSESAIPTCVFSPFS